MHTGTSTTTLSSTVIELIRVTQKMYESAIIFCQPTYMINHSTTILFYPILVFVYMKERFCLVVTCEKSVFLIFFSRRTNQLNLKNLILHPKNQAAKSQAFNVSNTINIIRSTPNSIIISKLMSPL